MLIFYSMNFFRSRYSLFFMNYKQENKYDFKEISSKINFLIL